MCHLFFLLSHVDSWELMELIMSGTEVFTIPSLHLYLDLSDSASRSSRWRVSQLILLAKSSWG